MIRLRFRGPPAVRLATSPALELVGYALALRDGRHPAVPDGRIAAWRRDLESLETAALDYALSSPGFIPDFMVPTPTQPFGTAAGDLAHIEAASLGEVADALEVIRSHPRRAGNDTPAESDRWAGAPDAFRHDVAAQMALLWQRLVEPRWAAHRGILEREVLTRGRDLALGGAAALLNRLHPDLGFDGDVLRVECGAVDLAGDCGPDLLLVPSVLVWPKVFVAPPDLGGRPILYYPARGAATMFTGPRELTATEGPDGLEELLGSRRTRVLRHLARPATTSDLAEWMAVSASGVSQHLSHLASLGLVCRTRVGRHVYYERTQRGDRLVALFTPGHTPR